MIHYEYVTHNRSAEICERIAMAPVLGLDLETTALDPLDGEIRLVQVKAGDKIYVIDAFKTPECAERVLAALGATQSTVVGHNLKFEQKWLLYHHAVELKNPFDTWRASELIHNGIRVGQNLWDVVQREIGASPITLDMQKSGWQGELTREQLDYAASDVLYLPSLRDALRTKLYTKGLVRTAKIEFAVILPESAVELNGFTLDAEAWNALLSQNRAVREQAAEKLRGSLPLPKAKPRLPGQLFFDGLDTLTEINLDSPEQILLALRELGAPIQDTNDTTLAMIEEAYPVAGLVRDYREAAKRCTSYSSTYTDAIHKKTGRIHATYRPFLVSGRYGIEKPNLGQIPREPEFRQCFRAPFGSKLIIGDWKNIEMVIVAEISGDPALVDIFRQGRDAHLVTASAMLGCLETEVPKKARQEAKPLNFGFSFGMKAPKLVLYAKKNYGVSFTIQQAEKFRTKWFQKYRGVAKWHDVALRAGSQSRVAKTLSGRIRHMPEDAYNEYLNHPVQGTGADMLKNSLRKVYDGLKRSFGIPARTKMPGCDLVPPVMMVHHVHDEIVLEARDEDDTVMRAEEVLHKGMREGAQEFLTRVPAVVEGGSGFTWAEK